MAIKTFNPTTPSRRNMTVLSYKGLSKVKPEKSLLEKVKKTAGRNSYGRITVRHTLGIEPKFGSTFGGSDGNTMMQHGIPCAVLSCGMYDVHSVREYAKVGDIVNGARLIAELITQGQEASIE